MALTSRIGRVLAPRTGKIAPGPTSAVVHRALAQAIRGVGPLRGAAAAADRALSANDGDVDAAVVDLIGTHVRFAGAQGFATNIGGLVTLAATVPANLAGLALLQCRMVAAIAHLRGYDLDDPRVRNAVLACILGESEVTTLVRKKRLPGRPSVIATATREPGAVHELDRVVAAQVATALVTRVAGRRMVTSVGKRVPVVGGVVGAGTDARATWKIGQYADSELTPRTPA